MSDQDPALTAVLLARLPCRVRMALDGHRPEGPPDSTRPRRRDTDKRGPSRPARCRVIPLHDHCPECGNGPQPVAPAWDTGEPPVSLYCVECKALCL